MRKANLFVVAVLVVFCLASAVESLSVSDITSIATKTEEALLGCSDSDVAASGVNLKSHREWKHKFSTLNEFNEKGTTQGRYAGAGKIKNMSDYCKSDTELVEYSCNDAGYVTYKVVVCPEGCKGGRCTEPPYCVDTDKGSNEFANGKVWYISKSIGNNLQKKCRKLGNLYTCFFKDFCDNDALHEFSCSKGTGVIERTFDCEYGCLDGKCKRPWSPLSSTQHTFGSKTSKGQNGIILELNREVDIGGVKVFLFSSDRLKSEIAIYDKDILKGSGDILNLGKGQYKIKLKDSEWWLEE